MDADRGADPTPIHRTFAKVYRTPQTTRIGDFVKVYQGVTLGALSLERAPDMGRATERHPTIEEHVTICTKGLSRKFPNAPS